MSSNTPLIKDEYGVNIVIGLSFDVSNADTTEITFLKPDCVTYMTVTATIGTSQIVTSEGTFEANEWIFYTFLPNELDQAGTWKAEPKYVETMPASRQLFGQIVSFQVDENIMDIGA